MLVSLLTCTGARPQAFAICEKLIKNQTYKGPIQWLCVDDYNLSPTRFTMGQEIVKPEMQWTPEVNTHRMNMRVLLQRVKGDVIIISEDDDWYSPNYIEDMLKLLEHSDMAGLSNSKYYHMNGGFKYLNNFTHASLAHTVFGKKSFPLLYRAVESGMFYFDIEVWKYAHAAKLKTTLVSNTLLGIGIKGMPGRKGLTPSHALVGYHADPDYKVFQEWLGADWVHYKEYLK